MSQELDEAVAHAIKRLTPLIQTKPSVLLVSTNQERWQQFMRDAAVHLDAIGSPRWLADVMPALSPLLHIWEPSLRDVPAGWRSPEQLEAHAPLVRLCATLRLEQEQLGSLGALLRSPALDALRALSLDYVRLDAAALRALAARALPALESLSLRCCGLGDAEIAVLADAPAFWAGLRALDLEGNKLRRAGAVALAACPHLGALESLDLASNPLGKEGRVALGLSPHLSPRAKATARALASAVEIAPVGAAGAREAFGELRSALQREPSAASWALVCDQLARVEAEQLEAETLPYAARGVEGWPAEARELPKLWAEAVASGGAVSPAARLARTLRLDGGGLNAKRAAAVARWSATAEVERLYIDEGTLSLKAWQALFGERWPLLHTLRCSGAPPVEALSPEVMPAERVSLKALSLLDVPSAGWGSCTSEEVRRLAYAPALSGLRELELGRSSMSDALRGLADAPWWWSLESLSLEGYAMAGIAQRALLGRDSDPAWTQLRSLKLGMFPTAGITSSEFKALHERMPALRSLELHAGAAEVLWRVVRAPWAALESLTLYALTPDEPAVTRQLTGWESAALRELRVHFIRSGPPSATRGSVEALMASPAAAGLEVLGIEGGRLDGARAPQVFELLPAGLRALEIADNTIGPEGVASLARQELPALRRLRLEGAVIPREGIEALSRAPWWSQLEALELSRLGGAELLPALSGRLPEGLRELRLSDVANEEAYVLELLSRPLPPGVEVLELSGCSVATKAMKALCEQLPGLPALHTLELQRNPLVAKAVVPLLESPALSRLGIVRMEGGRLGFQGKQLVLDSPHAPLSLKGSL
jgi:hypothetical protein